MGHTSTERTLLPDVHRNFRDEIRIKRENDLESTKGILEMKEINEIYSTEYEIENQLNQFIVIKKW